VTERICEERERSERTIRRRSAVLAGLIVLFFSSSIAATGLGGQVPVNSPSIGARAQDSFTWIVGVKELTDGRVVVVDMAERFVYLLDSTLTGRVVLGRHGQGPGEYLLPSELLEFEGDSVGVIDFARGRALVIEPDGTLGGFLPPRSDFVVAPGVQTDALGRFYFRGEPVVRNSDGTVDLLDEAPIERMPREGGILETIARVPVSHPPGRRAQLVGGRVVFTNPQGAGQPFTPTPDWVVLRDGTVAIVHIDPYRVEFVGRDGALMGPTLPHQAVPVSEAHEVEWCEQARPVMSITRRAGEPEPVYSVAPRENPCPRSLEWPDVLPPFLPGAAVRGPADRVWVRVTTLAGEGPTYDVIDSTGQLVSRVILPVGARLVGFGPDVVYTVEKGEFDLEWLYRMDL
jgi:hypothetical protein